MTDIVSLTRHGDILVFTPRGPMIEGGLNEDLYRSVRLVLAEGLNRIVIDLASVPWLNSSGIGTLMGCRSECLAAGGRIALATVNPKIMELFTSLMLTTVLDIFETVDEAVQALGGNNDGS